MDSIPSYGSEGDGPTLDVGDEQEEKARLISQVLELQNTLDGNWLPDEISVLSQTNHVHDKFAF